MKKPDIYSVANDISDEAPLTATPAATPPAAPVKREVRTKTLKSIPAHYFDVHSALRNANKTNLDLANYMVEALREKLERDGGL